MYKITLKIGGVAKSFEKDFVNIEDNLLAVEHQVRQHALYSDEKAMLNPNKHRAVNEAYLKMFVDMYGGQFKVDDLKRAEMIVLDTLNQLYLEALGGQDEAKEESDEKKTET